MMNFFKIVVTVGVVGVVLGAGQTREASAAPPAGRLAAAIDDGTLKSQIEASLKKSSTLAPRGIDVDVKLGVVTLKGTVRNASEKARAEELANISGVTHVTNTIAIDPKVDQSKIDAARDKTKAGVTKTVDGTANAAAKTTGAVQQGVAKTEQGVGKAADKTAAAAAKVGDHASDKAITSRVTAGLSGESLLKETAIDVETTNHVVTLKGTVGSDAAKARAAEIAGRTEGATRVVNQLVVKAT